MALMNIDYTRIFGRLRIFFENYNVSSYKLYKLYKHSQYKRVINYLASVAGLEVQRRNYDYVVPTLEAMDPKCFLMLCKLEQSKELDAFIHLIKIGAKEPIFTE